MYEEDIDGVALTAKMTAATLAAALTLADPSTALFAPAALVAVGVGIDRIRDWRMRACGYAMQVAAVHADLDPEDLVARLVANPAKVQLLAVVLEASSETAWHAKMRTLGRALATGALLDDDAKVMEESGWARIIQTLEAPHLRIIAHLCTYDPEYPGQHHMIAARSGELAALSGFTELIGPTLTEMESNGLVHATDGREYSDHFRARWGLTAGNVTTYVRGELAGACLARFEAAAAADD